MRLILLSLIWLHFTAPNGDPIYIVQDQIVAVTKNTSGDVRAHSLITTSQGQVFVRETIAEITTLSAGEH